MDAQAPFRPPPPPEQDTTSVQSSYAMVAPPKGAGTRPVSSFPVSSMGELFDTTDLSSKDIQRGKRKEEYRQHPFRNRSPPTRAQSIGPREVDLPIRLRTSLGQSSSGSVGSSPFTTIPNPDVKLPPINEARHGPGISPPTDRDGQPCLLPSLPPLAFDHSIWYPPIKVPSPLGLAHDIQHQPQDATRDVVHQNSRVSSNAPDHADEESEEHDDIDDDRELGVTEEETPQNAPVRCEFTTPCRMNPSPDGMHFRKVISHIFGRNKATTKLFPTSVWVHFCRKHYQRARYRADQWPFTQCELLLDSLRRMEEWNGVENFKLVLRRREQLRVGNTENAGTRASGPSAVLQTGRRHPTAITSPVPDWLHRQTDVMMSFDDIRALVLQIREYMEKLREDEKSRQAEASGVGEDGRQNEVRQQASRVRFPDVEILPFFKQWVVDEALRQRYSPQNGDQNAETGEQDDDEDHPESDGDNDEDTDEDEDDAPVGEIGRTGTNSGRSESQRRRSQRNFVRMVSGVTRVSNGGAVKKINRRKK